MKYRYTGNRRLLLIVNDRKITVNRGQVVELGEGKVKTSKLKRYMKKVEEIDPDTTFTKEEIKKLKKLLKEMK